MFCRQKDERAVQYIFRWLWKRSEILEDVYQSEYNARMLDGPWSNHHHLPEKNNWNYPALFSKVLLEQPEKKEIDELKIKLKVTRVGGIKTYQTEVE